MKDKILKDLNKEQKAAVVKINSPVRILAGAGSGKTKVLTRKIAYLIEVAKINPKKIIAVTFTNKAANEMKSRVEALIGDKANNMIVSTFHSLCYKFLREEISEIDNFSNNFAIIDSIDQDNILKEIYKKYEISKTLLPYNQMKDFISYIKNKFISIGKLEEEMVNLDDENQMLKINIFKDYQKALIDSKSLDFNDLLIYTKKILTENTKIRDKWRKRFEYFLIDEFQDTSKIQYEIIDLLAQNENITIVGDPDQTIYSWRGADISFINNFDKLYKKVLTITLSQNYRSTKNILKAANNLIMHNSNRIPKNLITENEEGSKVEYYEGANPEKEASWVTLQINKLKKEKNQLKDIAILYRSNFYSKPIEDALVKESIQYKIINGQKFYERSEIKDVLAFLRCIYEPTDISLKRIINVPPRKLGENTVEKLIQFANEKNMNLWNSWLKYINVINISHDKKQNLFKFIEILRKYNSLINRKEPLHQVLEKLLDEIGYLKMLEQSEDLNLNRLENVKELLKSIKNWESQNPEKYIREYLDFISLESLNIEDSTNINYVSLMTIHAAKGLEFKNVFVIGLNEGVFPSQKVLKQDDENGESFFLEEERRLAYVAFTRAKEKLFLSSSKEYFLDYKNGINSPSRFIKEADIKISDIYKTEEILLDSRMHKNTRHFEPGDKIMHINFGVGVVLDINGDSVIIEFKNKEIGIKQLLKNHKSIEKVN
ncbi:ATP-dependent helicase [Mesomycoplasma moatsii]|uniref:ATP-dependent helicase n=1 Tax=Mesomycoplasma moatsii TaxID=171287 RepID=UPI0003B4F978